MATIGPTWFEKVYVDAQEHGSAIPWANRQPSPDFVAWLNEKQIDGYGRRALVVGCGLGDDAEELARRGFDVVAFDIAPTAVKSCHSRFPNSSVTYQVADLFKAPPGWYAAFDFVLEYSNIQALPPNLHQPAMKAIARNLAPGGILLLINLGRPSSVTLNGPPWPLTKQELSIFQQIGLREVTFEEYDHQPDAPLCRFRIQYHALDTVKKRGVKKLDDDSSAGMVDAFAAFRAAYPTYEATGALDELREREYRRLDEQNHVYLDYTGGGLYGEWQLRRHLELLRRGIYGNPHSHNPASAASTALIEQARATVLDYFNALPEEYTAIFTANATGALKLVAESYPFDRDGRFLLIFDNHNSVNGIREFARAKGATVTYVPIYPPDMRVDEGQLNGRLNEALRNQNNLFAYPAQSNFSGVQHNLEWIGQAQAKGWDVLLDASAFVPTNRLNLNRWRPDFVCISFYKIFGYPTGIGCLLARKVALNKLRRPWFAGGTVALSSVLAGRHYLAGDEAAFEDGTVNYLSIPAVEFGLNDIASIGIETIHQRVACLTGWLLEQLQLLRHSNGEPVAAVYGPYETDLRGGTIAFNLFDPQGNPFDYRRIEELANQANISLRTGCFCNPGLAEISGNLTGNDMAIAFEGGGPMTHREFVTHLRQHNGKVSGAARISTGLVSNFADVYRFMHFVRSFLDKALDEVGEVEVETINCRIVE